MNKAQVHCVFLHYTPDCYSECWLYRSHVSRHVNSDTTDNNIFWIWRRQSHKSVLLFAFNSPIFSAAIGGFAKVLTVMDPNMKSDYPNLN